MDRLFKDQNYANVFYRKNNANLKPNIPDIQSFLMSKKIIIIFIALGFYLGIIAYGDFEKFSMNVSQFKIEFLYLIIFLNFFVLIIKGFRQQIILKKLGIDISKKNNLLLYLAGLSMLVTPGGAGQVIKSYFLKNRFGVHVSKSLPLSFVERFNDLVAMISIVTLTIILMQNYKLLILISVVWLIIVLIFAALRIKSVYEKIKSFLIRFLFLEKRIKQISESYDGLHLSTSNLMMMKVGLVSIIAWIIDAISVYLVFLGFNQNLDFIYTTFVMYTSLLLGFVTFIPSGLGITELSAIGLLASRGIDISLATSIIIMIRLTGIWFSTAVGLISMKIFLKNHRE